METGKAISLLAAKAKLSEYMGNIRSRVKVGARLKVTHSGPWLPMASPIEVPAKEAGPQPSNFNSNGSKVN